MRDFIEGLKASDNFADYLFEHKKETLKLAGFAVAILTLAMLFLYRGGIAALPLARIVAPLAW